jgi:hypothetical protein
MKTTVFCDVAPCSLAEIHWHFRGAYCLYHQGSRKICTHTIYLNTNLGEISGSHGGEYENDCLMECRTCTLVETGLRLEVITASIVRAMNFYQTTQVIVPEDRHLQIHNYFKPHNS